MKTAKIRKDNLEAVFEILEERYRIIGPRVVNGTVVLSEISFADIPTGYRDRQGAEEVNSGLKSMLFSDTFIGRVQDETQYKSLCAYVWPGVWVRPLFHYLVDNYT